MLVNRNLNILNSIHNNIFQVQYNDSRIQIIHPDNLIDPSIDSVVFQVTFIILNVYKICFAKRCLMALGQINLRNS